MRYFVAVAERSSFTRAAEDLFIAQQALSQQVKRLEERLGVELLNRDSRNVRLTAAGAAYLADCKRVLAAVARAENRVKAVASGRAGKLRVAYTLTAAYDTVPLLRERIARQLPGLKVDFREIFGGDVYRGLQEDRYDVAIAPATNYPDGVTQQTIRREPMLAAIGASHPLADGDVIDLAQLRDEMFELWPREMSPGYYDAVIRACHSAGFEPKVDDTASGSTAWANIAAGKGVNLVVSTLVKQPPSGIRLLPLREPQPSFSIAAVSPTDRLRRHPAVGRFLAECTRLAGVYGWL